MGQSGSGLNDRFSAATQIYRKSLDRLSSPNRPKDSVVSTGDFSGASLSPNCSPRFISRANGHSSNTTTLDLTSTQKRLIRETWCDDFESLYTVGTCVYVEIFNRAPEARQLFPAITKYGDRWQESKEFRSQALKFVQVISIAVRNLNNVPNGLDPVLKRVGAKHVDLVGRGFKPELWQVFHGSMQVAMGAQIAQNTKLNPSQVAEAVEAWNRVADYIVVKMGEGFLEALNQLNRTEPTTEEN